MREKYSQEFKDEAVSLALFARALPKNVIVHSDRGSQYYSRAYQRIIQKYQLRVSMSGKGNCYDNAVCESFFHTLKVEQIYRETYQTRAEAKASIFWYIEAYYNQKRKHSSIGYQSSVDFEKQALENANLIVR